MDDFELGKCGASSAWSFSTRRCSTRMNVVENIAFPLVERYRLTRDEDRANRCAIYCDAATSPSVRRDRKEVSRPSSRAASASASVWRARSIDRPEILLYDEPDHGARSRRHQERRRHDRRTADEFNVTAVVISHDMASTFRIADRISMLYHGKIVVTGTPQEVLASRHPALREFVVTSGLRWRLTRASWHETKLGIRHRRIAGARRGHHQLRPASPGERARHDAGGIHRLGVVPRCVRPVREVACPDRRDLDRADREAGARSERNRPREDHHSPPARHHAVRERGRVKEVGVVAGRVLPGDRSRFAAEGDRRPPQGDAQAGRRRRAEERHRAGWHR